MIGVTGANGKLGGRVVANLATHCAPGDVVALVRRPPTYQAPPTVAVRQADYTDEASMVRSFADVDTLLLVASNAPDPGRLEQHRAVIDAAVATGVKRIVYTSLVDCRLRRTPVDATHRATEDLVRSSGLDWTILRNGEYTENWTHWARDHVNSGRVEINIPVDALLSSATRDDLAEATAIALLGSQHVQKTYDLCGETLWSFGEFATAIAKASGTPVTHTLVSDRRQRALFEQRKLPAHVVDLMLDVHAGVTEGAFARQSPNLRMLLGRDPADMRQAVTAALLADTSWC